MITSQELRDMDLHDTRLLSGSWDNGRSVMRVKGGWLYSTLWRDSHQCYERSTFVPETTGSDIIDRLEVIAKELETMNSHLINLSELFLRYARS